MEVKKVYIILFGLCLFFGDAKTVGARSQETSADFSFECKECEQNEIEDMDISCLLKINSEKCKKIDKKERAVCGTEDNFHFANTGAVLENCFKRTLQSSELIINLLLYAVEYSSSMFSEFESLLQSSVTNYIVLEFFKLYRLAKGLEVEKALEAALAMGGLDFFKMWNDARKFLEEEYALGCYKADIRVEILCSFVLGVIVTVPGAGVLSMTKLGIKGSKGLQKAQKLFKTQRAQAVFRTSVVDFTNALERKLLQSAAPLKRATRRELNSFFKNMDKDKFAKQLQRHLSGMKQTGEPGLKLSQGNFTKQMKSVFVTALTARAISSGLSRDAFSTLTGGVTDSMISTYINQQIMEPVSTPFRQ